MLRELGDDSQEWNAKFWLVDCTHINVNFSASFQHFSDITNRLLCSKIFTLHYHHVVFLHIHTAGKNKDFENGDPLRSNVIPGMRNKIM